MAKTNDTLPGSGAASSEGMAMFGPDVVALEGYFRAREPS